MIHYDFPLYRPPAEAESVIIQATLGCSHNNCTFCSMYKGKKYAVRAIEELFSEIDTLRAFRPDAHRVFLADGDALALDTQYLISLLHYLQKAFPKLSRVSAYATAQNLLAKSEEALAQLYANRLSLLYFGMESGNDPLLKKVHKGVNSQQIIQALNKASAAKIKISATVILGLGGLRYSREHMRDTAALLSKVRVNYLSTLQLGLEEAVRERFFKAFDEPFQPLTDLQMLEEQRYFLELLHPLNKVIFRSNHASNALHLAGTLPKDRQRLLQEVAFAQSIGEKALVPSGLRGF